MMVCQSLSVLLSILGAQGVSAIPNFQSLGGSSSSFSMATNSTAWNLSSTSSQSRTTSSHLSSTLSSTALTTITQTTNSPFSTKNVPTSTLVSENSNGWSDKVSTRYSTSNSLVVSSLEHINASISTNATSGLLFSGWPTETAGRVPPLPDFTPEVPRDSPECTSAALEFYNITAIPTLNRELYTFTVPAGTTYTTTVRPGKYNQKVLSIPGPTTTVYTETNQAASSGPAQACCGGCRITAWYVDIMYWPQEGADTGCLALPTPTRTRPGIPWPDKTPENTANIEIPYPVSETDNNDSGVRARALQPTMVKRDLGNGTHEKQHIAISDGVTYTSPYLYLHYSSIWAEDRCGPHGGLYTSITWSFLPGQLSTLGYFGKTQVLNETQLPCGPEGYRTPGIYKPATVVAPPQMTMLEPGYKNCFVGYWQGLDPPFAFSKMDNFFEDVTTTQDSQPTPPPALPQSTQGSPNVKPTARPKPQDPTIQTGGRPHSFDSDQNPHVEHHNSQPTPRPTVTHIPRPTPPPATPIIVDSQTATFDSFSNLIVGSHTIRPGVSTTVGNTPVHIEAGHLDVRIGGSSAEIIPFAEREGASQAEALDGNGSRLITAGAIPIESRNGVVVIGSHTILPGAQRTTISGTPISVLAGGASAVVGSSTIAIPNIDTNGQHANGDQVLIGGIVLTPTGSVYVADGTTITPGHETSIHGTGISLNQVGTSVFVGFRAFAFPTDLPESGTEGVFEAGGMTFTQLSGGGIVVKSKTVTPGGKAVTLDGTRISLGQDRRSEEYLVIGTQMFALNNDRSEDVGYKTASTVASTTTKAVGDWVADGLDMSGQTHSETGPRSKTDVLEAVRVTGTNSPTEEVLVPESGGGKAGVIDLRFGITLGILVCFALAM